MVLNYDNALCLINYLLFVCGYFEVGLNKMCPVSGQNGTQSFCNVLFIMYHNALEAQRRFTVTADVTEFRKKLLNAPVCNVVLEGDRRS